MKQLNTQSQILPDAEQLSCRRQIISCTLQSDEERIKRFIRVLLFSLGGFRTSEEINERAAEIFQQVAVQSLEKAGCFDVNRSAYSWLNGFAVNLIKRMRNQLVNQREKFEDGFDDLERIENLRRKIETTTLPEETFWEKSERVEDEKIRFETLIADLKSDYQKILRLHYFEELSIVEIAARLGKSVGAAQRQLNRAEKRLREILGGKREKK